MHYHQLSLKHTLAQIDGIDLTASTIVKSVNVLMAIKWIRQAWDEVKPQTISNCFRAFPQELESYEDPFSGLEEELVDRPGSETTAQEYTSADDDLCTCMTFEESEKLRSMPCNKSLSIAK